MPATAQRSDHDGHASNCGYLTPSPSLDGAMTSLLPLLRRLAFLALLPAAALLGCGGSPPPSYGEPTAPEQVKAHLEAVGHAVEGGATATRAHLEDLGESLQDAAHTVGSAFAPSTEPVEPAQSASAPIVFEAPAH